MNKKNDIAVCVTHALDRYFADLDGETPADIYDMVIRQVERPLRLLAAQHTVAEVHARIGIPVELVEMGFRVLKKILYPGRERDGPPSRRPRGIPLPQGMRPPFSF